MRPRMVCTTCRAPVNDLHTDDGQVTYLHSRPKECDGHPVAPETEIDAISVCDFCSTNPPIREYPVKAEVMGSWVNVETGKSLLAHDSECWLACESCHELIQAKRWTDLARASVPSWLPEEQKEHAFLVIQEFHASFRRRMGKDKSFP